jgi:hypothetical protein
MVSNQFPSYYQAPMALLALDGNCGPICVWGMLRHFHKRRSSERIIRLCRHTKRHGTFLIALAVALREHGLRVQFYTEEDPAPTPLERRLYKAAAKLGIEVGEALPLNELLARIRGGEVALVSFDVDAENSHYSPLIRVSRGHLILPYTERGRMRIEEFEERWAAPGICRQCAFAAR